MTDVEHPAFAAYPPSRRLWEGIVLATLAHAICFTRTDSYIPTRDWNGAHYWVNDEQSIYGVVGFKDPAAFRDQRLVGLLCDVRSPRAEWQGPRPPDYEPRLTGMPSDLRAWMEQELLSYMEQAELEDADHTLVPIITAALWSTGHQLTAAEPWDAVLEHGGSVLSTELMEIDSAIDALDEEYGFSDGGEEDLLTLLRGLYDRKMADPQSLVVVRPWEREILVAYGESGLSTTKQLFTAIGIVLS